jgi:hypothetical protein
MRGLVHLRALLGNIRVLVLPDQVSISSAHEAFDESGKLKNARKAAEVKGLGKALAETNPEAERFELGRQEGRNRGGARHVSGR